MKYLCGKCIHFDVCYVPRTRGCVEICGHFKEEPKEPLTEQEYLQTCNTEQLADVLHKIFMTKSFCHICPENNDCDIGYECKYHGGKTEDFVEWLKQPHTIKE